MPLPDGPTDASAWVAPCRRRSGPISGCGLTSIGWGHAGLASPVCRAVPPWLGWRPPSGGGAGCALVVLDRPSFVTASAMLSPMRSCRPLAWCRSRGGLCAAARRRFARVPAGRVTRAPAGLTALAGGGASCPRRVHLVPVRVLLVALQGPAVSPWLARLTTALGRDVGSVVGFVLSGWRRHIAVPRSCHDGVVRRARCRSYAGVVFLEQLGLGDAVSAGVCLVTSASRLAFAARGALQAWDRDGRDWPRRLPGTRSWVGAERVRFLPSALLRGRPRCWCVAPRAGLDRPSASTTSLRRRARRASGMSHEGHPAKRAARHVDPVVDLRLGDEFLHMAVGDVVDARMAPAQPSASALAPRRTVAPARR